MTLQLQDLLTKGYLPKELPPPFTSASYATALAGPGATPPATLLSDPPHHSASSAHSLLRTGSLRRHLKIPNAVHFYRLAQHVCQHWTHLEGTAGRSTYSLSLPTTGRPDRAIAPQHSLSDRPIHRARIRSGRRFLVRADITRFFPSIYTHALPWALLGKGTAKAMLANRTLRGTWSDDLDMFARGTTSNQTVGLPIGPDTSRLLAEVLLGPIDDGMAAKFRGLRGMRYIDDYEFATDTRAEADAVLGHLQHLLNDYELELNPSKTRVFELPLELDHAWTSRLRTFSFRGGGSVAERSDLTSYFGLVFDYYKRLPEEGLLKYAVSRMRSVSVDPGNWRFYEDILQQCASVEPSCLPQVSTELERFRLRGLKPRKGTWSTLLNKVICDSLPLGHASESAWAMWLLWQIGAKLQQRSAKVVALTEDSIAALMALALADRGLADATHLSGLSRFSSAAYLYEPQWLLCYEGNVRGWLRPGGPARVQSDGHFKYFESLGVRFLDTAATVPSPTASHGGGGGSGY